MLTFLSIENFAIIEKCELDFHSGMTIITGETGAGKSIILDAIELILGARAESHLIRADAKKCEITAIFDIKNYLYIQDWLTEKNLSADSNSECFLRRILSDDGRSRSFINNQPVPLQLLRELGSLLVNLHGQHEHQLLLNRETHRECVDAYGHHEKLAGDIKKYYYRYRDIENQLKQYHTQFGNKETRLEFLQYQLKELSALNLTESSLNNLESEHKILAQTKDHLQSYYSLQEILDDTILPNLYKTQQLSQTLSNISTLLENAQIQLEEASGEIKQFTENVNLNPERLSDIENKLTKIYDLARKHRVKPQELFNLYDKLDQELKSLENMGNTVDQLEKQLEVIKTEYFISAKQLSEKRLKISRKISKEIELFIQELGMQNAKFSAVLIPYDKENEININGLEKIEFLVSANPGQALQPLSKVASGGELSRISLAIDLIAAQNQNLPVLIFDEVDVGIGGSTAARVGQLLKQLSEKTQVICITHLPQVAAVGKHHLHAEKKIQNKKTFSHIDYLNPEEKIHEIARMLGGIEITKQALSHARELVQN
jgi:DNA repair protein RecN (Recombination protein N)